MTLTRQERERELHKLHWRIRRCRLCYLWKTRQRAVPGEGPLDARAMLIGEAPGKKEDESGRPFVGPAGRFFDGLLKEAGIKRGSVFVTSTIKCLPVDSGKPARESIEACNPYLQGQVELVRPRILCLMGGVAAKTLLGVERVADIRGRILERPEGRYLVTYHPQAGRRFPDIRKWMRRDFELLAEHIG
ncbi:MAG: type-4 uracil-DNA glycosylase [Candidatus Abyssubacteria bacterium]